MRKIDVIDRIRKLTAAARDDGRMYIPVKLQLPLCLKPEIFFGIDLHKDQVTVVGLDAEGRRIIKFKIATKSKNKIRDFFASIGKPFHVVVEAVGFYHWFWDLLLPIAGRMILANATEVRNRAGSRPKTDFRDATWLATLLYEGRFDQDHRLRCFVPDLEHRKLREVTRTRHRIARKLARDKSSFRKILLKNNLAGPKDINSSDANAWLKSYARKLPVHQVMLLRQLVNAIILNENQLQDLELLIEDLIVTHENWSHTACLLMTIPGIALISAATLIAEIGDFKRFDHHNELVNYAGLSPRVFESAGKVRYGKISKQGPKDVRWILQQSAWVAIRCDAEIKSSHRRLAKQIGKHGTKKAAVAIARKLLVWSYYIVCNEQEFRHNRAAA